MIVGRDELAGGGWRVGVIDVGTNSIRLIVGEVGPDLSYKVIDDEKVRARLGEGLDESGALSLEAMSRSAETIARLRHIADGYELRGLRAVATSAVRDATNREAMLALVRDRAGIELEVLTGEDEARYAYQSVAAAFDLRPVAAAVLDIGGGSTELVISVNGVMDRMLSLPLGAIRLTERFGRCEDADGVQLREMRAFLRQYVREHVPRTPVELDVLFGSGGAVRSMAGISMHRAAPAGGEMLPRIIRGYEMRRREVRGILDRLDGMPVGQRASIAGLSPERADIIVAGVSIMERFMKRLGVDRLRAHDRGIRDGVLRSMIDELAPGERGAPSHLGRVEIARRFASACRYEEKHAEHVASLAVSMFDQIVGRMEARTEAWGGAEARELLHVAALLHDVGYLIGHTKHHKHSQHLIVHSELDGFTHRQLEIVASLARYHRGAMPKGKHAGYGRLSKEDRRTVRRLAAILRVAVGLDRTHTQAVRSVGVSISGSRVSFELESEQDPSVNIWEAERKADLLEKEFGFGEREWRHAAPGGGSRPVPTEREVAGEPAGSPAGGGRSDG